MERRPFFCHAVCKCKFERKVGTGPEDRHRRLAAVPAVSAVRQKAGDGDDEMDGGGVCRGYSGAAAPSAGQLENGVLRQLVQRAKVSCHC